MLLGDFSMKNISCINVNKVKQKTTDSLCQNTISKSVHKQTKQLLQLNWGLFNFNAHLISEDSLLKQLWTGTGISKLHPKVNHLL